MIKGGLPIEYRANALKSELDHSSSVLSPLRKSEMRHLHGALSWNLC